MSPALPLVLAASAAPPNNSTRMEVSTAVRMRSLIGLSPFNPFLHQYDEKSIRNRLESSNEWSPPGPSASSNRAAGSLLPFTLRMTTIVEGLDLGTRRN